MQSVNARWYTYSSYVSTVFAALLAAACIGSWMLPAVHTYSGNGALSFITFVLCVIHIVYTLFFSRLVRDKSGLTIASLYTLMLWTMIIVNLVHNTGRFHSWYLIAWLLTVAFSGMFGTYTLVGYGFLATTYFILFSTDGAGHAVIDLYAVGALLATYGVAVISSLLWRPKYMDAESMQVAQLSGALKTKQQQAEILIQSIADGIVVINTEARISLMNPAAARMSEWPVEEGTGIDVHMVIRLLQEDGNEIDSNQNPFMSVLQEKRQVNHRLQLIGRNGKVQIVSIIVSPILLNGTELAGAVAVFRDISAEREEEKRRADFISTASHEMRTPVAAIEGYLALALNDKVSKIDQRAREYLEKAHSSTQHLGKLFQDLLTSAKAEDGRLVSHPVALEMGAYLDSIVESLRFAAEKKGLLMDYTMGAAAQQSTESSVGKMVRPLYYVHVDPDRLREVITNLFDNAVKYTANGKISIGLTGNKDVVQFFVRDTGPGIPAEDLPHLFQKFYRVDNSATRTAGGTGLGLFICRKIIELYKGRIWAESEVNKGSTFYINLPRLTPQKALELQQQEAQSQTPAPVTSLTTPVV